MFKTLTRTSIATLAAALLSLQASHAVAQPITADEVFTMALQQYEDGRYAAAYGRFVWLANRGHGDAARFALDMFRFGKALYGSEFDAAPHQVRDWVVAASMQHTTRLASAR